MNKTVEPIWYSFSGKIYNGNFPAYWDVQEFKWTAWAEEHFERIRSGAERYLNDLGDSLQPYFHEGLISKQKAWKLEPFYNWGKRNEKACSAVPELDELFQRIDGLTSAALSRLEPGADILPHYGDTNAVLRCHLGLSIPTGLPECGLEVKGEKREWKEGHWLMFCDAHMHRAWNHSTFPRHILIIDVLLPDYAKELKSVCNNVRSLHELQQLEQRHPFVKQLPGPVRGAIRHYLKARI